MPSLRPYLLLASLGLLARPVGAAHKESPFHSVESTVKDRTGLAVRWAQDEAARAENRRTVQGLLQKPLTVNRAVQIALLNNRDLQATFEDIGVSAADLRAAGFWKNPSIDLSVRFADRAPAGPNWEEAAAFDLLDWFMIPLRRHVAAGQLAAAQLRVSEAVIRLVAEVKQAIYTLQADEASLGQMRNNTSLSASSLLLAQKQHEAGNITDLALLQQQSAYDTARLEAAMAEAEQRSHREKLNRLLSLWGAETDWKISGELPPLPEREVPLRGLEALAIQQRLDLAASHQELTALVNALGLSKTYRYIGALEFGVDTEREREGDHLTGPQLRLELPLFHQGQARLAKGAAELRRAESKFEALAINIRAEVRELQGQLQARREVVRFYHDELLPGSQAVLQATLLGYNGMLISNYELFAVRRQEVEAGRKSNEALRDYWITRAELERTVGGSLKVPPANKVNPNKQP